MRVSASTSVTIVGTPNAIHASAACAATAVSSGNGADGSVRISRLTGFFSASSQTPSLNFHFTSSNCFVAYSAPRTGSGTSAQPHESGETGAATSRPPYALVIADGLRSARSPRRSFGWRSTVRGRKLTAIPLKVVEPSSMVRPAVNSAAALPSRPTPTSASRSPARHALSPSSSVP